MSGAAYHRGNPATAGTSVFPAAAQSEAPAVAVISQLLEAIIEIGLERRRGADGPDGVEGMREGGDVCRFTRQVAENVSHAEPGLRVGPGAAGLLVQAVPARIVGRDDLAAIGFAIAVAAPEGGDEREAGDRLAGLQTVGRRGQDEFRLPVGAVEAKPGDGVADL